MALPCAPLLGPLPMSNRFSFEISTPAESADLLRLGKQTNHHTGSREWQLARPCYKHRMCELVLSSRRKKDSWPLKNKYIKCIKKKWRGARRYTDIRIPVLAPPWSLSATQGHARAPNDTLFQTRTAHSNDTLRHSTQTIPGPFPLKKACKKGSRGQTDFF